MPPTPTPTNRPAMYDSIAALHAQASTIHALADDLHAQVTADATRQAERQATRLNHQRLAPTNPQPCTYKLALNEIYAQTCSRTSEVQTWFVAGDNNEWACERHVMYTFTYMWQFTIGLIDPIPVQTYVVVTP